MTFKHHPTLLFLITANVLIFLIQQAGGNWRDIGALWLPESPFYHSWQWLTHQFLHDSVLHILFNMYAVGLFGTVLLRIWGTLRFLLLYLVCGFAAVSLHVLWKTHLLNTWLMASPNSLEAQRQIQQLLFTPMLGASGAVFGLLAAFAVRLPHVKLSLWFIPIHLPARWFIGLIMAYEIFAQFSGITWFGSHIAHLAHIGGALAGILFGAILSYEEKQRYSL